MKLFKIQVSCTPVGTCSTVNEPPKSQSCQAPPCNEPTTECRDKVKYLDLQLKNSRIIF